MPGCSLEWSTLQHQFLCNTDSGKFSKCNTENATRLWHARTYMYKQAPVVFIDIVLQNTLTCWKYSSEKTTVKCYMFI